MPRYIDAEKFDLFAATVPNGVDIKSFMVGVDAVINKINKTPSEDVCKKRYAFKTNKQEHMYHTNIIVCSNCNWRVGRKDRFCRRCGAKFIRRDQNHERDR